MNKAALRQTFLKKRMSLTQDETDQKLVAIIPQVIDFITANEIRTLHIFLSHHGQNEVNTWRIILALRKSVPAINIVAPYMIPGTRMMEHYLIMPDTTLITNRLGISEPTPDSDSKVLPEDIDAIILPLLAFDLQGFRVGYGGGYYDRFLPQCRPDARKIGLSFFDPVEKIDDLDEYDIRMDKCFAPDSIWAW